MRKAIYLLLSLLLLTGCLQSSAFVGPVITGATSGSMYNAGLSYTSSAIFKKTTGKTTSEYLISALEQKKLKIEQKKIAIKKKQKQILSVKEDFFNMVKVHISSYKKTIVNQN